MGPITLFDKSFLQSLSVDESVWFDHYFLPVVSPLFYVETLADLDKPNLQDRTPEALVRTIADKFPDRNGTPCVHHSGAVFSNLLGHYVPMNGTIPVPGGQPVKVDGRTGIVWKESSEARAFSRWQEENFFTVEREFASQWRAALSSLPVDQIWGQMREIGISSESVKTLLDAKTVADATVRSENNRTRLFELLLRYLGAPSDSRRAILTHWKRSGYPPLYKYAPYAAFVLSVEVFFQVAVSAGLIARERPSNRIDIAYLFYLPFCHVFVSNDKLHARCAPLFLRENQVFIPGQELKSDLRRVNTHYLKMRGTDEGRDVFSFPHTPPEDGAPVIARLWSQFLSRPKAEQTNQHQARPRVPEEIHRMSSAPPIPLDKVDFDTSKPDAITIERRVRRRKGSWLQVPDDV